MCHAPILETIEQCEDGLDRILIGVAVKYKGILVFLKHRQL